MMTVTIQLINQECSPISQFFLVVGFKAHVTSLNPMFHVNYAKKTNARNKHTEMCLSCNTF